MARAQPAARGETVSRGGRRERPLPRGTARSAPCAPRGDGDQPPRDPLHPAPGHAPRPPRPSPMPSWGLASLGGGPAPPSPPRREQRRGEGARGQGRGRRGKGRDPQEARGDDRGERGGESGGREGGPAAHSLVGNGLSMATAVRAPASVCERVCARARPAPGPSLPHPGPGGRGAPRRRGTGRPGGRRGVRGLRAPGCTPRPAARAPRGVAGPGPWGRGRGRASSLRLGGRAWRSPRSPRPPLHRAPLGPRAPPAEPRRAHSAEGHGRGSPLSATRPAGPRVAASRPPAPAR